MSHLACQVGANTPWSIALLIVGAAWASGAPIDREALLERHNPHLSRIDAASPLTLGNGHFAFSVDVTGLQTLAALYEHDGIPVETLARWAWYEEPNPNGYTLAQASETISYQGAPRLFPTRQNTPAGQWLRRNPRDFPLGEIQFVDAAGHPLAPAELSDIDQTLELWSGIVKSHFRWHGHVIDVTTAVDQRSDTVDVRTDSAALRDGSLQIQIAFPRGHDVAIKNTPPLDWTHPESHLTTVLHRSERAVTLQRVRGSLRYETAVAWSEPAEWSAAGPHRYRLRAKTNAIDVRVAFAAADVPVPHFTAATDSNIAADWAAYWRRGAAVDFTGSIDPRARELERRVVLSEYLMAVQFRGDVPPSETGLTCSSWYGKHNAEMVWWHVAQFALWGRPEETERALAWFERTAPLARERAHDWGLPGARWPKMAGPDGRESPGGNPLIIWNEPHPIALAELVYRAHPSREVLARWGGMVQETAECMSAMLTWNDSKRRYELGPPLWISQEIYDPKQTRDPCYELEYWRYGLETAQAWRLRAGKPRVAAWDREVKRLAALPTKDGKYVAMESVPDTWDNADSRHDHPSFLLALGQLPGEGVDRPTMKRTLDAVLAHWDWETKIWGWDYPMMAMTAARLNEPEVAVDILLKNGPNNHYVTDGNCPQRGDLALYLPANSSLLSAVALMVAGYDGSPSQPGIPKNGKWTVRSEGLLPLP